MAVFALSLWEKGGVKQGVDGMVARSFVGHSRTCATVSPCKRYTLCGYVHCK